MAERKFIKNDKVKKRYVIQVHVRIRWHSSLADNSFGRGLGQGNSAPIIGGFATNHRRVRNGKLIPANIMICLAQGNSAPVIGEFAPIIGGFATVS
jgi:hypothetical protein